MKLLTSRDNPLVRQLHALATSARDRRKSGESLLDGAHLISAALDAGWPLKSLIVSQDAAARAEIVALLARAPSQVSRTQLPAALFSQVSPVETPSGILALIDVPPADVWNPAADTVVVLDGVQDPGNIGTILRTAAAAGVADVLLTAGCAQAWSPKVLRAGMGAHFALRIREHADVLALLADFPGPRLATALGPRARNLYQWELDRPVAWMFGAEGQGLSGSLLAAADGLVVIPMAAGIESLNVGAAAAICLFEQRRQRGLR
ncbi:MAG: RNA methyltransferase [Thauera sp.]|nr:RNA methyltransferase [Thauera sp.]